MGCTPGTSCAGSWQRRQQLYGHARRWLPKPATGADVHGLLGDVAMESDDFGTALTELDAALRYLQKFVEVWRRLEGATHAGHHALSTAQGIFRCVIVAAHSPSLHDLASHPFPASAQEDDRRIAEVQYKRCCALQFSGEVEQALPAVQVGPEGCRA